MADHDAHVRVVKRLTNQIRNAPDPETRDQASETLDKAWTTYNRTKRQ